MMPLLNGPGQARRYDLGTLAPTPYRGESVEPRGNRQFPLFPMLHHRPLANPRKATQRLVWRRSCGLYALYIQRPF